MIRALLAVLWALVPRVLADPSVDDVVDLVPVDCDECGYPIDYCDCVPVDTLPHDLSDYDEYVDAVSMKCRGCGLKTTFTAGDIYPRPYAGPADPMCMACQALLAETVAR